MTAPRHPDIGFTDDAAVAVPVSTGRERNLVHVFVDGAWRRFPLTTASLGGPFQLRRARLHAPPAGIPESLSEEISRIVPTEPDATPAGSVVDIRSGVTAGETAAFLGQILPKLRGSASAARLFHFPGSRARTLPGSRVADLAAETG